MASPTSSSDSRSSYSPHYTSRDIMLDLDDPLSLLLNDEGESQPDWTQLSSFWPEPDMNVNSKPYTDMIDFSELSGLSMDVDFAIEPSALQFNPYDAAVQFPFSFDAPRRLSITSSSSSSGASLSSVPPESAPSPVAEPEMVQLTQAPTLDASAPAPIVDLAAELAERVRQSAGVMLALPMTAQLQALENQNAQIPTAPTPQLQAKLPIPRLPRPAQAPKSSTPSSAASTPPPSTPSPPPSSFTTSTTSSPSQAIPAPAPAPRPKTSHTTIERRYRTNLNARIQSLRMAVPALRVVSESTSAGGKKRAPNKVLVSSEPQAVVGVDVIDARGFVDGVKVARKCSKATVLGKAVEYIKVLKRREARLMAEQAGLKSLLGGLVGGPALLREWEREWRAAFGGPERDEIGEDEGEEDAEDDEEGEEDEDEEEGGRKRKRGKTAPVAGKERSTPAAPPPTGEKRKRGRPRKVVPAANAKMEDEAEVQPQVQVQGAQQYLLATFALFSFFNSPLTSSSSTSHVHTGVVLNANTTVAAGVEGWSTTQYVQVLHLLVSVLVLLSFIGTWFGVGWRSGMFGPKSVLGQWSAWLKQDKKNVQAQAERILLARAPASLITRLQISHQLTTSPSATSLVTAALLMYTSGDTIITKYTVGGLARARARTVWGQAQALGEGEYERMVLALGVDEAATRFSGAAQDGDQAGILQALAAPLLRDRIRTHLGRVFVECVGMPCEMGAEQRVVHKQQEAEERRRTAAAARELGGALGALARGMERVSASASGDLLTPTTPTLVPASIVSVSSEENQGLEEELLDALVLYLRVFPTESESDYACPPTPTLASRGRAVSVLLSPPPSPEPAKHGKARGYDADMEKTDMARLRRALGSRVFEDGAAVPETSLEDARDRVVDRVVELERRSVGLE
ncbi:hypothetical protein H0H81_000260 [Sphagnurus paluster]|uniref:BHLH domain-containing protein n=1 Tax=Sphagnurus paluster TaxID=117069 RepID=A0A9P7FPJ0_9AGAR|nr:hypothetical protein H0H81_000260 [Sphagnurus paluster]